MLITYEDLIDLFERSNNELLSSDLILFKNKTNERTLCGALMLHMYDYIKDNADYSEYHLDIALRLPFPNNE